MRLSACFQSGLEPGIALAEQVGHVTIENQVVGEAGLGWGGSG
jgi:hypothetical protein